MRKLLVFILYFQLISFYAQENAENLIDLDSTWAKEVFHFPINFAPTIGYQGFEEARFPPKGWSDEKHPNFWSYTFAWNINLNKKYSKEQLENDLKMYFDGLNQNEHFKTTALFTAVKKKNNTTYFKGQVNIYDNFKTKKPLQLNVLVESTHCKEKSIILFKFSPKDFGHQTWQMLDKIKIKKPICE